MSIKIYDPAVNAYVQVDGGAVSQSALLLNILIELQVHTMYLQNMSIDLVNDDPAQLRLDAVNNTSNILGS
jgi:hypothetical protein